MPKQQISQKDFIDAFAKLKAFVENKRQFREWIKLAGLKVVYRTQNPCGEISLQEFHLFKIPEL